MPVVPRRHRDVSRIRAIGLLRLRIAAGFTGFLARFCSTMDGVFGDPMRDAARLCGDGEDNGDNDDEFHSSAFATRARCAGVLVWKKTPGKD